MKTLANIQIMRNFALQNYKLNGHLEVKSLNIFIFNSKGNNSFKLSVKLS